MKAIGSQLIPITIKTCVRNAVQGRSPHFGPPPTLEGGCVKNLPTRILRDGILRSRKVFQLSPAAEVFYRRLMSVVDDFGRYYADRTLLLSDCFPLRPAWADDESMSLWIQECLNSELILVYTVNSTDYLEIQNFGQRLRSGQCSKFPESAGIRGKNPRSAGISRLVGGVVVVEGGDVVVSVSMDQNLKTKPPVDLGFSDWVETQYKRHPKKKNKILAEQALCSRFGRSTDTERLDFEKTHMAWCGTPAWRKNNGQFVPALAEWISDDGHLTMPKSAEEEFMEDFT